MFSVSPFPFAHFSTIDRHTVGRLNAEPHNVAPNPDNPDYDVIADQDVLVYLPGEYEHWAPPPICNRIPSSVRFA
jgi:hypothetical protein